jgi:hypothetical protein
MGAPFSWEVGGHSLAAECCIAAYGCSWGAAAMKAIRQIGLPLLCGLP